MQHPRKVPGRDNFYLGLAYWMSFKSKDPSTQCGAVVIDENNIPLGWGYNGPPKNVNDYVMDWSRPNKYPLIIHAEVNAINHCCGDTSGSILYVTAKPCSKCMLSIVDADVSKVVYYPLKPKDNSSMLGNETEWELTQDIAARGGVILVECSDLDWMSERFGWMASEGIVPNPPIHITMPEQIEIGDKIPIILGEVPQPMIPPQSIPMIPPIPPMHGIPPEYLNEKDKDES